MKEAWRGHQFWRPCSPVLASCHRGTYKEDSPACERSLERPPIWRPFSPILASRHRGTYKEDSPACESSQERPGEATDSGGPALLSSWQPRRVKLMTTILLPLKVGKKAGEAGKAGDPAVGQSSGCPWRTHEDVHLPVKVGKKAGEATNCGGLAVLSSCRPQIFHEEDSPNCERRLERPPILEALPSCPSLPALGNS